MKYTEIGTVKKGAMEYWSDGVCISIIHHYNTPVCLLFGSAFSRWDKGIEWMGKINEKVIIKNFRFLLVQIT